MKTILKFLEVCFAALLIVMVIPQNIRAEELSEIEVMSTVLIKADVPEDFTENIAFVLEDENTQVKFSYALTEQNEYMGELNILGGRTYFASATFGSSKYKTDLAEKYEIADEEVELVFSVTPIIYSIENDEREALNWNDEETKISDNADEDLDPETGLKTAKSVLREYEEKVSFIQNDPNFSSFLTLYSGGMFKKYYLNADPMNTEEQWDNMKEVDRFNYYITYYMPYTKMMNYEFSSANIMIEELISQKNILSQIEKGDIVYDAVVDVWKWHYSYWQHTGMFYNFYNYYDGVNSGADFNESISSEAINLVGKDKGNPEETEIKEEIKKDIEKVDNPIILWIKENWLTTAILLIAGISFFAVFLYNRKKNIYEENDK